MGTTRRSLTAMKRRTPAAANRLSQRRSPQPGRRARSLARFPAGRSNPAQLFLDGSAFKPGAIDAKWGEFMHKALTRDEQAQGKSDAHFGDKVLEKFDLPLDDLQQAVIETGRQTGPQLSDHARLEVVPRADRRVHVTIR